ncbi:FxsA family protein [Halocalculus aciditolerans]|uniref:Membrane protein FxsA n=1 Tax=Halocalculus aciditolerans TaxID=1383812 RepID=A0A830F0W9_9EURY|nr:FxsA family protein [Halocalculus aciditolerans]GGL50441.1 membrane protein FxsA [Halocalculus aciditolerans]
MVRLRWIGLGLLAIPLLDALFLVFVAGTIGWQLTVAAVVITALLGMVFVRSESRHTIRKLQEKLAVGETPTDELVDGGLLIAAGAFLLTPGLVTDATGFLLVFPPTRAVVRTVLKEYVIVPKLDAETGGFATGNVYTFGFPNDAGGSANTGNPGFGGFDDFDGFDANTGSSDGSGDYVDLDDDSYDIEFDDDDRSSTGN